MRPLIPNASYYDSAVYTAEQRLLFGRVWQYAGVTLDLQQSNDWITTVVGGQSVVIHNFDGTLRAFANVCSHRFARIRCEATGNGKLRCPYHGWIYNAEGVPYSIPARPRFGDLKDRADVETLALQPYEIATCGILVFVREPQPEDAPSLREFLGDAWTTLESMALALGERVYRNAIPFNANWKIAVENGLEAYHVGFVHERTFKQLGTSGMNFRFTGLHSAWYTDVEPETRERMRKLARLARMPYSFDGYVHQFVFPNLTVSSVCGTAFGFQQLVPISPTKTTLVGTVYLSRMAGSPEVNTMVAEMLGPSAASFTLDVAQEDQGVCERVQLGIAETDRPGILSEEEERVLRFQQAYVTTFASGGSLRSPSVAVHA